MIALLRPQPDARSVGQPEPAALGLLMGDLQPLALPDTLDLLAAARRLAEAECTTHEIGAITGHASLKEIEHYTKAVDQQKLAASAMEKTRTLSGQPYARLAKKCKKP